MAIYFCSDLHFGHKNIFKFYPGTRFGDTIEEMNENIVKAWNSRVTPDDDVWNLGDLSFGNADNLIGLLGRLSGRHHFIYGNHDKVVKKNAKIQSLFTSIQEYKELKIDNIPVILFHFPIAQWNRQHYGSFHLHGHCHGSYIGRGRIMDVGIDTRPNGDMAPWSWKEIKEILSSREIVKDHMGVD
jgi:calcineurin-like phosphoesterase family protein